MDITTPNTTIGTTSKDTSITIDPMSMDMITPYLVTLDIGSHRSAALVGG